jgi:hypothetical protein
MADKDHLSRKEAALFLTRIGYRISYQRLAQLACNGNALKGPLFTRYGWKTVSYARIDLIQWAEAQGEKVT